MCLQGCAVSGQEVAGLQCWHAMWVVSQSSPFPAGLLAIGWGLERTNSHLFGRNLSSFPELLMHCSLLRWLGRLCIVQVDLYGGGRHRIWTADATGGISRYQGSKNQGPRTHCMCVLFAHLGLFTFCFVF